MGLGSTNLESLDETALQRQIQLKLDQEKLERHERFVTGRINMHDECHDQYLYQSHDSHTNSYTETLYSAHSQQHSPHASAGSEKTAGYVPLTPAGNHPQNGYDSSHQSSYMNSSQHSSQTQNTFPHGNQIIVQDQHKPDLLK